MIQRDYILRLLEELSKILAKILLLKEVGKLEEALNEMENYSQKNIGIKLSLLETLSSKNILDLLSNNQEGNIKCLIVVKLLKEKGKIFSETNFKRGQEIYHKSLILYLKAIQNINRDNFSNITPYFEDIFFLEKELKPHLTDEEMFLLFKFYEKIERYEKAEDYLFFLKNRKYPSILEEGKKFFQKLEEIDESILNRCGLTKTEIKETYEEFIKN